MLALFTKIMYYKDIMTLPLIPFLIILAVLGSIIALAFLNEYLPFRWFCDKLGWHCAPEEHARSGIDNRNCMIHRRGICPRCGKKVMQDSQGNWF